MDSVMREKMVEEAVKRMKTCGLYNEKGDSVIEHFKKDGTVFVSKPCGQVGVIYRLNEAEQQLVKDAEENYNILVYHVIRNNTGCGVMYAMLYVSQDEEEWEMDNDDLEFRCNKAYPVAYVANVGNAKEDDTSLSVWCGEFGSIGIAKGFGGLVRTD